MADQFPTCSKCGKVFEHASSKSRHQKNCKKGPDVLKVKKTYNCPNVEWCEQVFNKISNYKRHKELQSKNNAKSLMYAMWKRLHQAFTSSSSSESA